MTSDQQAEQRERARQSFLADTRLDAANHWDVGRAYYFARLNLGGTTAHLTATSELEGDDVAGAVEMIESVGWQLDNVGYAYQPLRERSHVLTDSANLEGRIIGVFMFRRPPQQGQP
jgi:hypothetical protein